MLLMAIFSLRVKTWAAIVVWFILAPVAHRLGIGPLYVSLLILWLLLLLLLVEIFRNNKTNDCC